MKFGIPACVAPDNPDGMYFRLTYHETFFGPFMDEATLTAAINTMDEKDPWWDYDGLNITHGMNPLPSSYSELKPIDPEMRKRIETQRKQNL